MPPIDPVTIPLAVQDVSLRAGERTLCRGLCWQGRAGECWAVLGPNGAGKTTLLHVLAGLVRPRHGTVLLAGRPLASWRRRDRARRLGLLLQEAPAPFPASVLETVLAGRHPHLGPWQREGAAEREIARHALLDVDLAGLGGRDLATLSGGERQRARIAALLAQDPPVTLLDEPTQQLDLRHQQQILALFRRRAQRPGHLVVMVLHDPNLALQYCSHALLLGTNGDTVQGPVAEVMTRSQLEALYGCTLVECRQGGRRALLPALDTPPARP